MADLAFSARVRSYSSENDGCGDDGIYVFSAAVFVSFVMVAEMAEFMCFSEDAQFVLAL